MGQFFLHNNFFAGIFLKCHCYSSNNLSRANERSNCNGCLFLVDKQAKMIIKR